MIDFHPGVVPNNPARPRLYFSAFRKFGTSPPTSIDYTGMPTVGMLGNDVYGDCVFANNGHLVEEQTFKGQGSETVVTTTEVLASYSRVTGFDPNNPATDQGAEIQAGLDDLRKVGLSGHHIVAFAQLDVKNLTDVKMAVFEFGAVSVGFDFPAIAMTQFQHGQPWDAVPGDGGIEGGHCVTLVGYDANYFYCYTWGQVQRMTPAFWNKYVFEAWTHADQDWFNTASGLDPEGVDKYAFGAQYAALTGQANPFPPEPPPPPPLPPPPPQPPVVLDAAEQALVKPAYRYLQSLTARKYLADPLAAWLRDKGQSPP